MQKRIVLSIIFYKNKRISIMMSERIRAENYYFKNENERLN